VLTIARIYVVEFEITLTDTTTPRVQIDGWFSLFVHEVSPLLPRRLKLSHQSIFKIVVDDKT